MVCNGGASCVAGTCVAPPCPGGLGLPGPRLLPTGSAPRFVVAVDLNGDGKPDLVVANGTSNTVSVLLGNGSGAFAAKVDYPTGTAPVRRPS